MPLHHQNPEVHQQTRDNACTPELQVGSKKTQAQEKNARNNMTFVALPFFSSKRNETVFLVQ